MKGTKARVFVVALALALLSPSCSLFHRPKTKVPPAPQPPPAASQTPPQPRQVSIPEPPDVPPQQPDIAQPPASTETYPPAPPRRTPRARPRQTAEPPAPAPAPAPAAPDLAQPVPQLEQILTPTQQQAYNEEIDRNLARAQHTVAALHGRRLNGEQRTYLDRIRTFIQQAAEARKSDLFRAKNLAERAGLLADDLLRSIE